MHKIPTEDATVCNLETFY